MKKQILLLIFTVVFGYNNFAAVISQQQAQLVALNFYKLNFSGVNSHQPVSATLKYVKTESDNSVDFYVFDIAPEKGFVIVAANDIIIPVLAYSNETNFNTDFHLKGLNSWVNKTATNIHRAVQQQITAGAEIVEQWRAYNQGYKPVDMKSTSVGPLCTTTWDQESGGNPPPYLYNLFCPYNSTDAQRALTGCVATSMAQIMKFWNYPAQGVGSFSYVDNTAHGYSNNYGTLSSNFAAHTYNWSAMPRILTGSQTLTQDSAVDLLMYDCGVSVGMDFGDDNEGGSGAEGLLSVELQYGDSICSQYAFVKYFSYDPDTIQGVSEADYSAADWTALIKHDLDMGRPVLYEGDDTSQGGHAWVCDGYDISDKLHMNWGWSGMDDGYFAINNLTTSGNFNPILHDDALIGILPKHAVATDVKALTDALSFGMFPNPASNRLTIQLDGINASAVINIDNILGQTIVSKSLNGQQSTIDISTLSNGIYMVQMIQGEKVAVRQLVVTK